MNLLYCGDSNIKDGLFLSIKSILKVEKEALNIYVLSMDYLNFKKIDEKFNSETEISKIAENDTKEKTE